MKTICGTALLLYNVPSRWSQTDNFITATTGFQTQKMQPNVLLKFNRPYVFSWITHLPNNPRKTWMVDQRMDFVLLKHNLTPTTDMDKGWKSVDDNGKVGYASDTTGSELTVEFRDIGKTVGAVTFMVMMSYGEEWVGSEVTVEVYVFPKKGEGEKGVEGEEEGGRRGWK